jgi:hypothetical protein
LLNGSFVRTTIAPSGQFEISLTVKGAAHRWMSIKCVFSKTNSYPRRVFSSSIFWKAKLPILPMPGRIHSANVN